LRAIVVIVLNISHASPITIPLAVSRAILSATLLLFFFPSRDRAWKSMRGVSRAPQK
jgi:hypothetical protein